MTKRGDYPADLQFRLGELEAFTGSITKAPLDLYVSVVNGDDTNEGTNSNEPLATIEEAEKRIPSVVEHQVIIHVGPHSGNGYTTS